MLKKQKKGPGALLHKPLARHWALKVPVWWRRAVLPSLPWAVCFVSFFLYWARDWRALALTFFLRLPIPVAPFALTWQPCLHVLRAREQGRNRRLGVRDESACAGVD